VSRKILIIVENAPIPADPRVWKEALALCRAGYAVTVLSPIRKGYTKRHEIIDGIHVYRHPMPGEGNGAFAYIWEYCCALFWESLYSWWIYFRHGFHVIQACNPPDDIFLVALPFKLFGVKFIFDHHDVNPELYLAKYERKDFLYRVLALLEKLTFRCSDVVIATNESYKEIAITRGGVAPDRVFVVRNGPDLTIFNPVPPRPELKHGKKYLVGYVGVMSVQDGLDILLGAAEYIKALGRKDIHFTCVGGGPAFSELQRMVVEKNIGDVVNFTGRIPDEDLIDILSTADICVNPDKPCRMNDISTMIKIMEYMALEKPIVQFDLKEGRISAQEASLYADKTNTVADFADKIMWLADHPEERRRMGRFGRMRVETKLAWSYSVEHLLGAYDAAFSLITGKRIVQSSVSGSQTENTTECSSAPAPSEQDEVAHR
jgi:glycosyltransferase involved in cell wall biosynthesis